MVAIKFVGQKKYLSRELNYFKFKREVKMNHCMKFLGHIFILSEITGTRKDTYQGSGAVRSGGGVWRFHVNLLIS